MDTLRAARARRQWNDRLAATYAVDPEYVKRTLTVCADCPRPCEDDEVCATAIASGGDLFDHVGREQAFHLVESGMRTLRMRNAGRIRESGDETRPNVFLSLIESDDGQKM